MILLLVVFRLVFSTGLGERVLCIHSDGHIGIESPGQLCCQEEVEATRGDDDAASAHPSDDDCVDYWVGEQQLAVQQQAEAVPQPFVLLDLPDVCLAAIPDVLIDQPTGAEEPPSPPPGLRERRTVVLLI